MHFWFITFDGEPFVTLLQHIRYVESATTFPMLDYFHVANAGWFAISIMTLSSPLFNRGSFLGKRGLFTPQTTRLAVLRVVFPITCLEFIAGPKIKNMGFLSGGDDLKRLTQCYAEKPNVRHCLVYVRQVMQQIYANLKKFKKITWLIYVISHPITCLLSCITSQLHEIVPLAFARWPRRSIFVHSVTF